MICKSLVLGISFSCKDSWIFMGKIILSGCIFDGKVWMINIYSRSYLKSSTNDCTCTLYINFFQLEIFLNFDRRHISINGYLLDKIDASGQILESFHITLLHEIQVGHICTRGPLLERRAALNAKRHFVGGHFYRRGAHFVEVVVGGCGALWSLFCPHDANLRAPECHFH